MSTGMAILKPIEEMQYIIATDVGSTTTKARFFHKEPDGWRFLVAGEAPTTVEAPFEDVTMGVLNAIREIEEITGHKILKADNTGVQIPYDGTKGVDLYVTTSSAGGGLQMMVGGLVKNMTAESANRAALGAGAIVMDTLSIDDGRQPFEKIKRIRSLRPDMILLAGGTDGGDVEHVMELAELVKAAQPKPRLGLGYELPFVYAGNNKAASMIEELSKGLFACTIVENIRPTLEVENNEPARRAIHKLFMEHVMSHAPGYNKLMKWASIDIMPTPAAEGMAIQLLAQNYNKNSLGVGLGGATTNVYSVWEGRFVRSVSANLGMSYSISNVLKEAGISNVARWLPFDFSELDLRNRLMNKMIRPTTIPQTLEELIIEHSIAREALRLGLRHHKSIATRLKGAKEYHDDFSWMFDAEVRDSYIDMMKISCIAGTGGLLSHAPDRVQSMQILTDAFQPEGVTWMFQDSVFMMPHLGVLSTVHNEAALQIFDKDCLVKLGTVIAPRGIGKPGTLCMEVKIELPEGKILEEKLNFGDIKRIPLAEGIEAKVTINTQKGYTISYKEDGSGSTQAIDTAMGGEVGLILDARGRPLQLETEASARKKQLVDWFNKVRLYPNVDINKLLGVN
jgi:uncharacterized protein (TIGR01319 family)